MTATDDVMETYVAMWNATDEAERRRLAAQVLTDDGCITYPSVQARGWDAIVAAIGSLHRQVSGIRFTSTSGVEQHHGWLRASWRMDRTDGKNPIDGEDVGELSEDGRFRQVIGFHDPLPPPG